MKKERGVILPVVLLTLTVLMILIPALVFWLQHEARLTNKDQRSTIAFNLAEAGLDKGVWKLKSSTGTWNQAVLGTAIAGYTFDVTYDDIPGGQYRIIFSSAVDNQVQIIAEGRDSSTKEVRAIKALYKNMAIPGAIISGGVLNLSNAFEPHWGPVMAQDNIVIADAMKKQYFPRKFSKQCVICKSAGYERDNNGLDPPNTDNQEWWSDYPVPDLPVLDFATLRASAAATGTLNIYGCSKTGSAWTTWNCSNKGALGDHKYHFANTWRHPLHNKNYVWYWDNTDAGGRGGSVEFTGSTGADGSGIYGMVIVRGNCAFNSGDNLGGFSGPVPKNAWKEYSKLTKTAGDTTVANEYPADDGYQKNRTTFNFGSETWANVPPPLTAPAAGNTDVGIRGFVYVGGDLTIQNCMDIYGAIWVQGDVYNLSAGGERCIVFYDETINNYVPTLNVVLVRQSWDEIIPSVAVWP